MQAANNFFKGSTDINSIQLFRYGGQRGLVFTNVNTHGIYTFFTDVTKLDMHGVLSVADIFGGKTVRATYMSQGPFVAFSLQVKQIRETCPAQKLLDNKRCM